MFCSYENLSLFIYKDCQVIVRLWETITRGGVWRRYAMLIRLGCRWRCWWWWWWYCCIGCITAGGVMCSCDIWSTLIFPFTTLPNISTVMAQQFITTTLGPLLFADGLTKPPHHTTSPHHTKSHQITTPYHHTISNPTTSLQQLRREYRHADTDVTTTPHHHTKLHNITTPHHTIPHSNWEEKTSLLRLMSSEQWQFVSRTDWVGDVNTGLCRPDNWAAGSDPVCFISSPAQPMITVSVSVRVNWGSEEGEKRRVWWWLWLWWI